MAKMDDISRPVGNAGVEFNYSVWTAGSRVTLTTVPWNNDYRDIVGFRTQASKDAYLDGQPNNTIVLTNIAYLRPNEPIRLNIPFSAAYKFNYIRVKNAATPHDQATTFYYFITDVIHRAPNTTEFMVQLDVWMTFGHLAKFGQCYVERGHIGIANSNQMDQNGRKFLTVPEGLDLGGEYQIAFNAVNVLADVETADIVVATTVSLEGSGVDAEGKPVQVTSKGSTYEGIPNGMELYHFGSPTALVNFLKAVSNYPWIANGIVSITAVPNLINPQLQAISGPGGITVNRLAGLGQPARDIRMIAGWRDLVKTYVTGDRYKNLKKFLTFPYTFIELTTHTGVPIILKPESMYGDDLEVTEMMHIAPPTPRVAYFPKKYNAAYRADGTVIPDVVPSVNGRGANDGGEFMDLATGLLNLPTFSVVNSGFLQYMGANANSIAFQHASADWSQQKALTGNSLASAQATAGMQNMQGNTNVAMGAQQISNDITNRAAMQSSVVSGLSQVIGGAMSGPGGLAAAGLGVAGNAANTVISTDARNAQTANSLSAQGATLRNNLTTGEYMRDSNKEYADFAATGDYENTIAAINAKVQDAKMIQPTTAGQVGGDAFLLATYRWELQAKVKTLHPAAMAMIGEYWLRYGYAVNRFVTPNNSLMTMKKFTYWKMKETYLAELPAPETFRQAIRGIFEKGVTVWANPLDIGVTDLADNDPLGGISL